LPPSVSHLWPCKDARSTQENPVPLTLFPPSSHVLGLGSADSPFRSPAPVFGFPTFFPFTRFLRDFRPSLFLICSALSLRVGMECPEVTYHVFSLFFGFFLRTRSPPTVSPLPDDRSFLHRRFPPPPEIRYLNHPPWGLHK